MSSTMMRPAIRPPNTPIFISRLPSAARPAGGAPSRVISGLGPQTHCTQNRPTVPSLSRSLPYENLGVALVLNERIESIFSIRSIVAICFFVGAAAIFAWTRLGRDIIAIGSDRRAAMTADVKVDPLVISIFAFSGLCASLSGVLLSYSLASASPAGLSDVATPDRGLPSSDRAFEIMSPYQNHANWITVAVNGYPPGKARNRCPT